MIDSGTWSGNRPTECGWYWFRADPNWSPPLPALVLKPDAPPVVVIVGETTTSLMCVALCVRFPQGLLLVSEMQGAWSERICEPK